MMHLLTLSLMAQLRRFLMYLNPMKRTIAKTIKEIGHQMGGCRGPDVYS